ncbi:hypothetical protein C3486_00195 [Streptomyces sp. Ru73]|uniref:hypothetical protein n=1 Tax=Streptomyces sp. Ru73 TaxID=2080748 RepID=UPI000CDD951A|nr:hypothetical protein [Streptomyces sp. Ru73]POX43391.1 hypothetical protein C3486_00195 [Streptomyces sp. Ru73]
MPPDYRIDGFAAATERVADDFDFLTLSDDMYASLAAHHTSDGLESFLLLYDGAAIWDAPGAAEYVAIHIERDPAQWTFTFDVTSQPTVPLAQRWLITRGCPAEVIEPDPLQSPRPADALTSRLEDQLRHNPGDRYTLLDHYTHNPGSSEGGIEVSALFYDAHPDAAEKPYRLFLEETSPSFATYTVREGAFPTAEAADGWLRNRDTPLPLPPRQPKNLTARAAAARSRTTTTAAMSAQNPAQPGHTPATSIAPRSRGRRS